MKVGFIGLGTMGSRMAANLQKSGEQLVVFNKVLAQVAKSVADDTKSVILVRGGPGSGKSVVALNLVGALCAKLVIGQARRNKMSKSAMHRS